MVGGAWSHGNDFCESFGGLRFVPKHLGINRRENFVSHFNPLVADAPQEKRFVKTAPHITMLVGHNDERPRIFTLEKSHLKRHFDS